MAIKSIIQYARSIFLLLLSLIASSCCNREYIAKLNRAESIMGVHPDSALVLIQSIDESLLHSDAIMARYSLLHAMALDKNYIDTTDVTVIMPAVDYYRRHGTPDERLRTYYYLGRIQENAGDLNSAAVTFSIGERAADEATDIQTKGLLYMAFADIYNKTRNRAKEEEYVKMGIKAFKTAGDTKHSNLSSGRLAIVYYSGQEWQKADSLFSVGIEQAKGDTVAMSVFLSNYARLKVVQPEQDPLGSLALLQRLRVDYKRPLSLTDYGVWAYAASLSGDQLTCVQIENQLKKLDENNKQTILYWLYRIEQHRGNYEKALEYNIESDAYNAKLVDSFLFDSIGQTLQSYYSAEGEKSKRDAHILKLEFLLIALGLCLTFLVVLSYQKHKRDKREREVERLLIVGEESNRLLTEANENLQDQVNSLQISASELNKTLMDLRKVYVSTYKDKFSAIGELCNAYIYSNKRTDKTEFLVRKVEGLIAYISDDDKLHMRFENQINKDLNNIIKHMKADLGDIDKKESRFICYCIVGFDPEMIGTILGLSISNVYTKKSRLKERIKGLDSPYKEEYLRML
jgi:tetratricopeptide (TPR) repeat protein